VVFAKTDGILSEDNSNLFWDNTNSYLGINTDSPTASLDVNGGINIANDTYLTAYNAAGNALINLFKLNTNNQIEVGVPLNIGTIVLESNENNVDVIDMVVTSALTQSSEVSYVFRLDNEDVAKVYAESDGSGGVENKKLIIDGKLEAIQKSFVIPIPNSNKKLEYGVVEGPEHTVFYRGILINNYVIELPEE